MLEKIKQALDFLNVFETKFPKILSDLSETIPNNKISKEMKLTIAVSELITFASQFRRNILHYNGSLIPINAITFCLSKSGSGKDSSVNLMRKNFSKGYKIITTFRVNQAIQKAIEVAKFKNLARATESITYSKFYEEPLPLFVAPSTNEGFIRYLNELDESGLGAGHQYSGEFSSDLETSSVIIQNLQLISELYDEGKKEVKVLKSKENQSKEIKNLPVNALFVSSPDNILYQDEIKKKFKLQFTSKLARRSFFNFSQKDLPTIEYPSIEEMLLDEKNRNTKANEIRVKLDNFFEDIAKYNLEHKSIPIRISKDTIDLILLYKAYNEEISETIPLRYEISKIVTRHLYWKALKLAGALSLCKKEEEISLQSYKEAIAFTEMLNEDMQNFEIELAKESYEVFATFMSDIIKNNPKHFIGIHTLKKMGFISGTANIFSKIKDLCHLAGSYDESGVYKASENGIEYSKIIKTNEMGISYKECSGTKEERFRKCNDGFTYSKIEFSMLSDMLAGDYAYSPFEFKNGIRNKANLLGKTKWIALDIDNSLFSDEETHQYLANFNHHIVRTSNKDNAYKFRVLLELDSYVDLDEIAYKSFIKSIAQYLSLDADILPKSQIYFSYKNRNILSVIDKEPIPVREHLINAYEETSTKIDPKEYSQAQKKTLLANPLNTFSYAYNAKNGEGSIALIRCAKHAKDLGMSKEEILKLIESINSYWEYPMEETRFQNTILNQIKNWRY